MSVYKIADTKHSVEKNGVRLSTAQTADELQRLAEENERLRKMRTDKSLNHSGMSTEQSGSFLNVFQGKVPATIVGLVIGTILVLVFLNAESVWDWLWNVIVNGWIALGYALAALVLVAFVAAIGFGLWWVFKKLFMKDVTAEGS